MILTALEVPARWNDPRGALASVDAWLGERKADVVLLPEACLTGYVSPTGDFNLTPFAETRDGPTAKALAALAKKHETHLVGPLVERDGPRVFNAMVGFDPSGREIVHYRKRHPWFPETWATRGDLPHPVFVVSGVRFTLAVCFDIHFCVSDLPPADVLLFPSAWVDGPAEGGTSRTQGEEGRDSRLELVAETKLTVVNANWGVGEPRVTGQGGSMIVREGNVVARASSSGRIDYSWAIGEMSS